ncbi:selenium metabolism-associated LysR family transcriptional regulator [Alkalihalobacterium chitinilyticum]|uniref:Selenium metabolism-associated LysR family transcriptional regulator n=1 Tax=Alkalihalobacterium chitinilyticum TaxID=2980103 RepID=A0ABT5VJC7_9BACI|nr:selenium metabolism-associated LysR family transcriptional regulator [Alkalihalobacterium chitinilyticum]MDE5415556.1 selenium metabolism-associated LysR family transcriptional regulator [Alkalihalobacterium chitinilyticum]
MSIDNLRIYVTVVEQKNFSKAAKLLNLSQPNVSLHIRNLENEFEATLLHRSPKQVKVTEEGKILYVKAKQMLSLYDEAKQEMNDRKNIVQGTIKIGASFTIGEYILPKLLAEYARENRGVTVEVTVANTEEVIERIRSNDLDIGLVEGEVANADVEVHPFMEDEMIMIAPANHTLAQLKVVKPEMLQEEVWIWRESGSGTRAYSDRFMQELNLNVKHSFIFSSSQGIKEAVSEGLGIAMISKWTVRKELQAGTIKRLNINNRKFVRHFSLVQSKNPGYSKAHQLFIVKIEGADRFFD